MKNKVPDVKLSNQNTIPGLGLGTWMMDEGEAEIAVKRAIDLGYRHFDTAFIYHNEVGVGKAIRQKIKEGVVKRDDVFITTKLWNTSHSKDAVLPACRRSHRFLSIEYIDLYLVHWPFGLKSKKEPRNPQEFDEFDDVSIEDTWRQMERCVDEGLVRSIGVANFNSVQLVRVLNVARIKPVVNQIECHIGLDQRPLLKLCRERGVTVVGYCPLGAPYRVVKRHKETSILEQPEVLKLASKYSKTAAQVALRYLVQLGIIPIPKAMAADHMTENLQIFDFELLNHEMEILDKLDKNERFITYPFARHHPEWPFRISY